MPAHKTSKLSQSKVELMACRIVSKALYAPYHPKARRLYNILKKRFGFDVIYKTTKTLGDIILKKGRQIQKRLRRNVVYRIPCAQCPKKYGGQTTATLNKQSTQKLVPKEVQEANLKSTKNDDGMAQYWF